MDYKQEWVLYSYIHCSFNDTLVLPANNSDESGSSFNFRLCELEDRCTTEVYQRAAQKWEETVQVILSDEVN